MRQAFLALMTAMTPRLSRNNVAPFVSLFLSYCASAMTHIYDDIRLHSLDFLNLWMGAFAVQIVESHTRILPQFLSLLSNFDQKAVQSQTASLVSNPSGRLGSSKSRISVLSCLFQYLDASITQQRATSWFDLFRRTDSSATVDGPVVRWTPTTQFHSVLHGRFPFLDSRPLDLTRSGDQVGVTKDDSTKATQTFLNHLNLHNLAHCQQFLTMMMGVLLETWIESVPGVSTEFVAANAATNRSSCLLVLEIILLLWEHHEALVRLTPNRRQSDVAFLQQYGKDMKKHFAPHFPFGSIVVAKIDTKTAELLRQMNVLFCRVSSLLLVPMREGADELREKSWQRACLDFTKSLLVFTRNAAPLPAELFETLLPVLWRCLVTLPESDGLVLLRALVTFGDGAGAHSNIKKHYLDFISRHYVRIPSFSPFLSALFYSLFSVL